MADLRNKQIVVIKLASLRNTLNTHFFDLVAIDIELNHLTFLSLEMYRCINGLLGNWFKIKLLNSSCSENQNMISSYTCRFRYQRNVRDLQNIRIEGKWLKEFNFKYRHPVRVVLVNVDHFERLIWKRNMVNIVHVDFVFFCSVKHWAERSMKYSSSWTFNFVRHVPNCINLLFVGIYFVNILGKQGILSFWVLDVISLIFFKFSHVFPLAVSIFARLSSNICVYNSYCAMLCGS